MNKTEALDLPIAKTGEPLSRKDGRAKVTGKATYSAEWPQDNTCYAYPVVATIPKGKIRSIDTSKAESLPGILSVMTHENAPRVKAALKFGESENGGSALSIVPLQDNRIWYGHQYIALVIAESIEMAREGASRVRVEYDEEPFHSDYLEAGLEKEKPTDFNGLKLQIEKGSAEKSLKASNVVIDQEYTTHSNQHNAIELHATIAEFKERDGAPLLQIFDASQAIQNVSHTMAHHFGLRDSQVEVVCKLMGGAFGSKGAAWPHVILTCMAAKLTGRRVKFAVPREYLYGGTGYRSPTSQRIALGAKPSGELTVFSHSCHTQGGRKDIFVESATLAGQRMYAAANRSHSQTLTRLDVQCPSFMRAPGETPGMFAIESAMDELAVKLNMDPIELRRINDPQVDPVEETPFSGRHLLRCFDLGAKQFGWKKRSGPRQTRVGDWFIGMGTAAATYPAMARGCEVGITAMVDGSFVLESATHEMGTGTTTAQSQLAAAILGVPADRVSMQLGDSTLPKGVLSGGSMTTASTAGAVQQALVELKKELLKLCKKHSVEPFSKAIEKDCELKLGSLYDKSGNNLSIQELLQKANTKYVTVVGKFDPPRKNGFANHSFGAQFAEVAVHEELGLIRIRRLLGCFACGRILNAKTARSQFLGGIVMGVGQALMEDMFWDHRFGRVTNDNIAEYHVPVNADMPDIDIMWIDDPDYNASPTGAKGIGEIGITGVSAAIANAVFNAIGRRFRELPLTPEKIMRDKGASTT